MAEFLVNAKANWMDSLTTNQVSKLPAKMLPQYNARSEIGDIIVVKPDGWKWGKAERLPDYVVIRVPTIAYEAAKEYELPLRVGSILLRRRKYRVPLALIESAVSGNVSQITITKTVLTTNLIAKVS